MDKTSIKGIALSLGIALTLLIVTALLSPKPAITGFAEVVYRIYAPSNETNETEETPQLNLTENYPPIFLSYYPVNLRQIINPGDNLTFFITYGDPNNDYVFPRWYKDGALVSAEDTYAFVPSSLGEYNVTVVISDLKLSESRTWLISVVEKLGERCAGVKCSDSVIKCPDGIESRCKNSCGEITGECSLCTPLCFIYPSSDHSQPYGIDAEKGAEITKRTVPCIIVNETYQKTIDIDEEELTEFIKIPSNYSAVLKPFNLNCVGHLDLTVSVPNNYIEVMALRCQGIECKPAALEKVSKLQCGPELSKEFLRKTDYLEPKAMPLKIQSATLNLTSFNQYLVNPQNYQVRFYGSVFGSLVAKLSMPRAPIEEAKNPSLKIVGTPMILNLGEYKGEIGTIIKMPYTNETGFEKDSISMYAKTKSGWDYMGGAIDSKKRTVTAEISDISKYLNEKHEATFALMGVLCGDCLNSSLNLIYEPLKPSRKAVVLVHGLASSPLTYREMIDDIRLTQQPYQLWVFAYPSERSVDENAKDLMKHLEVNSGSYDEVYIIAHSLGGVVVQQALYHSHRQNQENPSAYYSYLKKVKKVLLVGAPNEGSPVIDVYKNLLGYLMNLKSEYKAFNPSGVAIQELIRGMITPRVPGINYYVIAGTNPLEFNLPFFRLSTGGVFAEYEKNDGIISTKSAQHVGEGYINDLCENYWEINVTHTDLIDHPLARQLIEKVVSEELLKQKEQVSLLGANNFFRLELDDCSPDDRFIIIGKKISPEEVYDETGCSCGNGVCGFGEDKLSCPSDCIKIKRKESIIPILPNIIIVVIVLLVSFVSYELGKLNKLKKSSVIKLSEYLHENFDVVAKDGYAFSELVPELLEKGFSRSAVNEAQNSIKKAFFRKYTNMREFMQKNIAEGHTKKYIKEKLVMSGWSDDIVDEAFVEEFIEPRFRRKIFVKEDRHSKFFRIER